MCLALFGKKVGTKACCCISQTCRVDLLLLQGREHAPGAQRTVDCDVALCLQPLSITLKGITNDSNDPGVDIWRTATFPLIRRLIGLEDAESLSLKVCQCPACCVSLATDAPCFFSQQKVATTFTELYGCKLSGAFVVREQI